MHENKKGRYTVVNWKVSSLIDALSDNDSKSNRKITIPKFQRRLVWTEKQKQSFIDSLKKEFPFGSLLAYETGKNEYNITQYSLIDGLQRSNAIKDYDRNPTKFFDMDSLDKNDLQKLSQIFNEIKNFFRNCKDFTEENLNEIFEDCIMSVEGFEDNKGYSSDKIIHKMLYNLDKKFINNNLKEMPYPMPNYLAKILLPLIDKIKKEANIYDLEIPIIIYSGPEENLPTIFERLNTKGTSLSKYEVFAALWSEDKYNIKNIKNPIIRTNIKKRYEEMVNEGFEIENIDIDNIEKMDSFNVFEYLISLGTMLVDRFPNLFSPSLANTIAFNLCSTCLLKDTKKVKDIADILKDIDPNKLEKELLQAITIVQNELNPFLTFKSNKKNNTGILIAHSDFQIISIITSIYIELEKHEFKTENIDWFKNIKHYYLYDIIKSNWKGSGDSKTNDIIKNNPYKTKITKKNWDNTLDEWLENQLQKKSKTRVKDKTSHLFLNYLYTYTYSYNDHSSLDKFEYDHIIPVNFLKEKFPTGSPMNTVSNLALINQKANKSKSNSIPDKISTQNIDCYKSLYPDLSQIPTIKTLEDLNKFLKARFVELKECFYYFNKIL